MKLETFIYQDRFDILLEKRLSGVAGLRYKMLYGKCQFRQKMKYIKNTIVCLMFLAVCVSPLLLSGCRSKDKPVSHVVLISIDTCRADYFSCYGFDKKTTPNIDKFAKESVLYEQCITPAPMTLPAHCSMLTGTNPVFHGVHLNSFYTLDPVNTTLAELLKENSFTTGAVVSSFVLDRQFGMDQGFDTYHDTFKNPVPSSHQNPHRAERRGNEASQMACQWLEKNHKDDFFLFLHYYDPHVLYTPPEPFASQFKGDPYAGEIAYTDACIQQVLDKLKELKIYKDSLIIITADHGEALGDHGEGEHGFYIYQSGIHVPLIVRYPRGRFKKKKVSNTVGLVDILPTICRWTGIQMPSECIGQDLTSYLESETIDSRHMYSETLVPADFACGSLLSLTGDRWKYIQSSAPELYDLSIDPAELDNRIKAESKRARIFQEELKLLLTEQVRTTAGRSDHILEAQSRAKLESLGYIASGAAEEDFEFDTDKDAPANWLQIHIMTSQYKSCFQAGRYDEAEKVCLKIMGDKPYYVINYYYLAMTQYELGKYADAITTGLEFISKAKKKIQGDSRDKTMGPVQMHLSGCRDLIGKSYFRLKQYDNALQQFTRALETETQSDGSAKINSNMGYVYLAQGQPQPALEHFQKAVELDPQLSQARSNIGLVYVQMGKFDKALVAFEKAMQLESDSDEVRQKFEQTKLLLNNIQQYETGLEKNLDNAVFLDKLAISYFHLGVVSKAIQCWQKSLSVEPDNPEVLNNLAFVNAQRKDSQFYDSDKALAYAEKACKLTNHQNPSLLDTLALIHATRGDFQQAIDIAQQAMNMALSSNQAAVAESIKKNLQQYQQRSLP